MIRTIETDFFGANVYLIHRNGHYCLIDCGGTPEFLLKALGEITPEYILLTHGHIDHILSLDALWQRYRPKVVIDRQDLAFLRDPSLNLSQRLCGFPFIFSESCILPEAAQQDLQMRILPTPGHTPGSVTYLFDHCAFTGDTMFQNGIGSTDFPLGDLSKETKSIQRLLSLPPETAVYPGHGAATTIAAERKYHLL